MQENAREPAGLTSAEARARLAGFGPNDPAPRKRRSRFLQILAFFLNPLVVILLIAAAASGFLGEVIDAILIVAMVLVSVVINFIQTWHSEAAAEGLRSRVAPTATVRRDGEWRELPRVEIVPGDIVRLTAGDLVPGDAKLISARDLYVQQSALTGESIAVEKDVRPDPDAPSGPDARHLVFLGTSVVSGTAVAEILTTGPNTVFGDIARRLTVRPEETPFERGMKQFGLLITRTVFFLVLFIVVVRVAQHKDAFESLLFAVALAVGLTPEFLPMISSVTLARGAIRMAEAKVIVKRLESIENFGSIDVLCSDKTGTITTGSMAVHAETDAFGKDSDDVMHLAWLNAHFATGLHSPLDAAILQHRSFDAGQYEKLDEIPFDFERRRSAIVVRDRNEALLVVKGAPESVFAVCGQCLQGGVPAPMDDAVLAEARACYERFSSEGLRVLAVASRRMELRERYEVADETGLTLAGFVTFLDPPVKDAAETIAALQRDGVALRILTGDGEAVTRHICGQVGLNPGSIVNGDEIDRLDDQALAHVVEQTQVFARVSPGQKTRILLALKHRGHAVGFMGDGINDAPSLHAADVGISVSSAVDVARDAADIILTEPSLAVLHNGIMEGRRAFGNVNKYLLMGTSSNFGNMFSMAGASLYLPFLPMLPTQILLNNFLYDMAQVTIPSDNVDEEYVRRPQRWDIGLIRDFMILIGPISSIFDFLTFWVMLSVFHAGEPEFHTGWFVESLATQTLVLFVIRTRLRPWKSRPSLPLALTTIGIVLAGIVIPLSPLAPRLGFTALPASYYLFLAAATAVYLGLVEGAKGYVFRRSVSRMVRYRHNSAKARPGTTNA